MPPIVALNFVKSLFEGGELTVARPKLENVDRFLGVDGLLRDYLESIESTWRLQCPGTPPKFIAELAEQALASLELFCQAIIFRDFETEQLKSILSTLLNVDSQSYTEPSVHYSVDVSYRFLPQIAERASRLAPNDPLLVLLEQQLRRWPLSSVGAVAVELEIPVAIRHPSLWQMYIDRIITHEDKVRLNDPMVKQSVETALGPHHFLAPSIARIVSATEKAIPDNDRTTKQ